jgi:hypothetical protein
MAAVLLGGAVSALDAAPASATGTYVHRICDSIANPYSLTVKADYCVGFDYSGTGTNRLRAYAKVVVGGSGTKSASVTKLVLGDGNGVISTAGRTTSATGVVEVDTPLNYQCHRTAGSWYNAHAYFSVTFPGNISEDFDFWVYYWNSVGTADDTCTNAYRTYYARTSPFPPGYVAYGPFN